MAPTGKVFMIFGLLVIGLSLEFGGQVQSGELAEARAQVVAMLDEMKPDLRSRKETQRIFEELKTKPSRDFYEETLFRQLEKWVKEPEFQKKKSPLLLASKASKFQARRKVQRTKKKVIIQSHAKKVKAKPSKKTKLIKLKRSA